MFGWLRRRRTPPPPPIEHPLPGEIERERADLSVVVILSAVALVVAAGLWLYTRDREMVASDGTTTKQTTGSGSQELPVPQTPRMPAAPSPPQQ
jgi:hypothetical protein